MNKKLLELIQSSQDILITSHISPDPDAVTSVLLLGATLQKNFPEKRVRMALDEEPTRDLSMLKGYENLIFGSLYDKFVSLKPDLFIMLDVAKAARVSRDKGEEIKSYITDNGVNTVIIDHHEEIGRDEADVYINERLPATAMQVYRTVFDELGLNKPEGYADIVLLGILSDTNRFKYQDPQYRLTFSVVSELLDAGASIEKLETRAERFDKDDLQILAEFLRNTTIKDGYSYSFLTDDFIDTWTLNSKKFSSIKSGSDIYTNNYLRNIGDNFWGFVVYREIPSGENVYSARFRAIDGSGDMSKLAGVLGGGGHKGAAGAKFDAANLQEALLKVQNAISITA